MADDQQHHGTLVTRATQNLAQKLHWVRGMRQRCQTNVMQRVDQKPGCNADRL